MKTQRYCLGILALAALGCTAQGQIIWNFTGLTGAPSATVANLSGGLITAANLNSGSLVFNSTSASSGYVGSTGGGNAAIAAKTGALSTATSSYFELTLNPASGYAIQVTDLTLGSRGTATAPTFLTLYSSADNFTSALASTSVTANSTWLAISLSSFSVTGAADTPLTLRLFGSGGVGSVVAANWRIDDVSLSVAAITAIPEPSTVAPILGVVALTGVMIRRRRLQRAA
jgi:hypothetical protein